MNEIAFIQMNVTSILSRGRVGGAIFAGMTLNQERVVCVCDHNVVPDSSLINKGQQWSITGLWNNYGADRQLKAHSAELLEPSGLNIITWIAECQECVGIGRVKAHKLYAEFGSKLIEYITLRDVSKLCEVISNDAALSICDAFENYKVAASLLWLDRLGISTKIGRKVVQFYKDQAQQKIEGNPYRLISFSEAWEVVDKLARTRFGVSVDDPRRLESAVEEVLYAGVKRGHTCLPLKKVIAGLKLTLGDDKLVQAALLNAGRNFQYKSVGERLQPMGTFIIEKYVADRLSAIAGGEDGGQTSLFGNEEINHKDIEASISEYEAEQGFVLTEEQKVAVHISAGNRLSLILGGAGTGKTTVMKAVYKALEATQPGLVIYQQALAGRAAQRIAEATGRESMTIASFINNKKNLNFSYATVIVIDEMSMVDVLLMYRLLRALPPGVRLILIGDPSQLAPIGPGLVLHALVDHPNIAQTKLLQTKRQSEESGIPSVATDVRNYKVPTYAKYQGIGSGVSFVNAGMYELNDAALRIYEELGGKGIDYSIQILSVTRAGDGGVIKLNQALHEKFRQNAQRVHCIDTFHGEVVANTLDRLAICVGDQIMFTENDYELGLRNGSLGIVLQAFELDGADPDCCVCEFEGKEYFFKSKHMNKLTHSYSITIHKSQGSQFKRIIVPIRKSRLLDNSLIYTAITRGVEQVILVGNQDVTNAAIQNPAFASLRSISLPMLLA